MTYDLDQWRSPIELAALIGVSGRTIERWQNQPAPLPYHWLRSVLVGGRPSRRTSLREVGEWLRLHRAFIGDLNPDAQAFIRNLHEQMETRP